MRSAAFAAASALLLLLATLAAAPLPAAAAASAAASASSDIITLTDANFDSLTSSGSWLLEFWAPWCGHCKTLAPLYEEAAHRLRGTINLGAIDATAETALAARFDIKGFPSLKFLREGEMRNYNGPRTVDGLTSFGREMNAPAVAALHKRDDFDALPQKHPVSIVFFGGKGGVERRVFDSLAYRLQGLVKFFSVEKTAGAEVYAAAGVSAEETPLILLVTKHADLSDGANRYAGPWVDSALRDFILRNKLPLISELDQSNFEDVTTSGKKIVYAVVNSRNPTESQAYISALYALAKQPAFRDHYIFAAIDGIKYNKYVAQFGVSVGDAGSDVRALPTVVVLAPELDYFYAPLPRADGSVHPIGDVGAVEQFLHAISAGSIGLTGTTAWYNPSRYVRLLEKALGALPAWQVAVLATVTMLLILALMFWACFAGLDPAHLSDADLPLTDSERAALAAQQARHSNTPASTSKDSEGLRARKPKAEQ